MKPQPGYYSLIQYCPDLSRLESVNVGLVLFAPTLKFPEVRLAERHDRLKRVFGKAVRPRAIEAAKKAIRARLRSDDRPRTLDEFKSFIDARGNDLLMTPPRPVKIMRPEEDLAELFAELVEEAPKEDHAAVLREEPAKPRMDPRLESVFRGLVDRGQAEEDLEVEVPKIGRHLHIPYAYRNGVQNLVFPQQFPGKEEAATRDAMQLAVEGDLLHRYPSGGERRLVVVASFPKTRAAAEAREAVAEILSEYPVQTVLPEQIDEFVRQVRKEAHG